MHRQRDGNSDSAGRATTRRPKQASPCANHASNQATGRQRLPTPTHTQSTDHVTHAHTQAPQKRDTRK
eukprot:scaffold29042_cov129-Isochrysis_galbana.AAC.1